MAEPPSTNAAPMSRIGLGTVQFGMDYGVSNEVGQVASTEVSEILVAATEAGIRMLDTAASYGAAEEVLGRALLPNHRFDIVTKTLPLSHGLSEVEKRARRSLEYLGQKPLDAILVHAARDLAGPDGPKLWELLERLRGEGLFKRIGISAYVDDNPLFLAERYRPDLMQVPFSLLDQRLRRTGALDRIKETGAEIHARSIFLQGLLLMNPSRLPAKLVHSAPALAAIRARIEEAGMTPIEAALGFVLSQGEVDVAIVGITGRSELSEIVAASRATLSTFDWAACAIDDPLTLTPSLW
jgi:aryl-alcohol dehydrogenase-like predicted oxidoreductase